ncbi:retrovirus-related pol polyprotein from transposon TNT 1-94 [Tanacetum coccineum]
MDEKISFTQKILESKFVNPLSQLSKSVNSSKLSQESKPNGKNTDSSKLVRPKPLQKPKLKCELCHYTNYSTDDCYRILYCMKCKSEDHRTSYHNMHVASQKRSENYKAQPYRYASHSKQILKAKAKPFLLCTHCGFNDHHHDDCQNYPECEIYGSHDHFTLGHNRSILVRGGVLAESSKSSESSVGVSCKTCGSTIHSTTDHNEFNHFKRETHQGAHLVPGQWMLKDQEERIDYDQTFAPVARMEAIRIFLAFSTYTNFKVFQMDVKSAFLNGKLKEEFYVKQPPGFESSEFPNYVCKLDKALYGLKQAPRAWYENLSTFLIQNKFVRGKIDNTLFIFKTEGDVLLVKVYMDDIIFGLTNYKLCKHLEKLMIKKFEISMMGELTYFLGLQIKQDDKGISIYQEKHTRDLLEKFDISDSSSVKTPMVPPNNLGLDLAGKPTSVQSKIITSHLKGTPSVGLWYLKCSGFDLKGYSDSNYVGGSMDRKITSGSYQILRGKLVCWSAKKQQLVAMSSAEAEYVVAAGCCANIMWMKS